MVAEFEPMDAVYFAWWPGAFDDLFGMITLVATQRARVKPIVLHHGPGERVRIEQLLSHLVDRSRVDFLDVASLGPYHHPRAQGSSKAQTLDSDQRVRAVQTPWIADWGPLFIETAGGRGAIVDTVYFGDRVNDDAVPTKIGRAQSIPVFRPTLQLDGGNLLTDGLGTCFTVARAEEYVSSEGSLRRRRELRSFLGCRQLVRLRALEGERTGHVDVFLKVAPQGTILLGAYDPVDDHENSRILDENARLLQTLKDLTGRPFRVLRVPMPDSFDGVYRTYLNSAVINEVLLVPTYQDYRHLESRVFAAYRRAFPGSIIFKIPADALVEQGGAIHCVTRARPARSTKASGQPREGAR
ncbi:MAG: agmatine deiminase family protein [bacterium]